jgi:acyl-CoA thioesterase FadM
MNLYFRLLWLQLTARLRPAVGLLDTVLTPFRVLPTDLDVSRHVNNGVFLSLLDLGRLDLLIRAGAAPTIRRRRWYPVVTAETIGFRRPLHLFQRFRVETRVLGWDQRSFFIRQRFLRGREPTASALVVGRFLGPDGSVPPAEVARAVGVDPSSPPLPDWTLALASRQERLRKAVEPGDAADL